MLPIVFVCVACVFMLFIFCFVLFFFFRAGGNVNRNILLRPLVVVASE